MSQNETMEKALQLISDNLGDYTANLYRDFYKDKDRDTIIKSAEELLNEMLGESNTQELIEHL